MGIVLPNIIVLYRTHLECTNSVFKVSQFLYGSKACVKTSSLKADESLTQAFSSQMKGTGKCEELYQIRQKQTRKIRQKKKPNPVGQTLHLVVPCPPPRASYGLDVMSVTGVTKDSDHSCMTSLLS